MGGLYCRQPCCDWKGIPVLRFTVYDCVTPLTFGVGHLHSHSRFLDASKVQSVYHRVQWVSLIYGRSFFNCIDLSGKVLRRLWRKAYMVMDIVKSFSVWYWNILGTNINYLAFKNPTYHKCLKKYLSTLSIVLFKV